MVYKMKILIIESKDKRHLRKVILYNNAIKKVKAKVRRLNKDTNELKVNGETNEKFDLIEVVCNFQCEPNFKFLDDDLLIEMIPHVLSEHHYFDSKEVDVNVASLISQYLLSFRENEHNVYQYNLI